MAITNYVRALFEVAKRNGQSNPDTDGILLKAQEFAGHASSESTMGYIRLEKSRDLNIQNKEDEMRRNREQFARDEELAQLRKAPKLLN